MSARSHSPRVTVVVGTWNRADVVPEAIDSILTQTLEDFELIVADDGSADETTDVLSRYRDERLRHRWGPHVGISRNLNRAIAETQGEYIALLDSDDASDPGRLARQVEILDARPEVGVTGFRMREIDEAGRELVPRMNFVAGDLDRELLRLNCISNSCAMVRRSAFREVGGFNPRYAICVDWELWLRISDRHVVHVVDEVLGTHRRHEAQLSISKERAQIAAGLRARVETLRRRRTLRGVSGLAPAVVSYCLPVRLKNAVRRRRGIY